MTFLHELSFSPDIIGITETWLSKDKPFLHSLNGYSFIHKPCEGRAGGAGIFIRSDLQYEKRDDLCLDLNKCDDIWIELLLRNNKKLVIGTIYRNPSYNFQDFQKKLSLSTEKLSQCRKPFIFGGDLNINLLSSASNVSNFKILMESLGSRQIVCNPTRMSFMKNYSLLDHFYTNLVDEEISSETISYDISDHVPVMCFTKAFVPFKAAPNPRWARSDKNFNVNRFLEDLDFKLRATPFSGSSGNLNWNLFEDIYLSTLNKHAPLILLPTNNRKQRNKPWITKSLQKSIRYKNKLYKKALDTKDNFSWNEFKNYRNNLTRKIELAKRQYYRNKINLSSSNPKKLWKTLNDIVKLNNKNRIDNISLNDPANNTLTHNSQDVSNIFNNHFTTIGVKLSNKIPSTSSHKSLTTIPKPKKDSYLKSLFLTPLTSKEVIQYISELNSNKATKSDCPPTKYIKLSSKIIAPIIAKIFNQCIEEGVFPDNLKIAEVIPIFKKGIKTDPSNYRPISLLSALSKIFERHIYKNLIRYITKHQILYNYQYGFRQNSSTEIAVTQVFESLVKKVEDDDIVCAIFLDLAKAFDTVDHAILISKLSQYGIRGKPLMLIKNYLSNRYQITTANASKSSMREIKCGVPQGSILGPLFFLLYINDLPNCSLFEVKLFADDACLILNKKCHHLLEITVNNELNKVNEWMQANKLTVNYKKTNYMIFSKNNSFSGNIKLTMSNNFLERVHEMKYLGVIFNDELSWKSHIESIRVKISRAYYILTKIRHYVDQKTLILLYYSMIHSHLQYCVCAWGKQAAYIIKPLETIQNRSIQIITKSDFTDHVTPLYKRLKILKLKDIYNLKIAILLHKIHNNQIIAPFNLIKINQVHSHYTRFSSNENYYLKTPLTTLTWSSFTVAAVQAWRNITAHDKSLPPHMFKKKLKESLIQMY